MKLIKKNDILILTIRFIYIILYTDYYSINLLKVIEWFFNIKVYLQYSIIKFTFIYKVVVYNKTDIIAEESELEDNNDNMFVSLKKH